MCERRLGSQSDTLVDNPRSLRAIDKCLVQASEIRKGRMRERAAGGRPWCDLSSSLAGCCLKCCLFSKGHLESSVLIVEGGSLYGGGCSEKSETQGALKVPSKGERSVRMIKEGS